MSDVRLGAVLWLGGCLALVPAGAYWAKVSCIVYAAQAFGSAVLFAVETLWETVVDEEERLTWGTVRDACADALDFTRDHFKAAVEGVEDLGSPRLPLTQWSTAPAVGLVALWSALQCARSTGLRVDITLVLAAATWVIATWVLFARSYNRICHVAYYGPGPED